MGHKASLLREHLASGRILKIMGAHNGLGAKLIERHGFDGIWASGLEVSTAYALPDANILTMTETLEAARAINDATRLPVVCDCDTGYGNASNVKHMVKRYEAAGLAAVVIEDKHFPKVNSFVPGKQDLVSIEEFCGKIRAAKEVQQDPDFMVIARIEALIAGWGLEEALRRAHAYADAGVDGIVIHSKSSMPEEVFAFSRRWNRKLPLVAIPTTYYAVTDSDLQREGFSMAIYANHGLRAAIRAMDQTFKTIAETGTTAAVEKTIASMKEVFELQGMGGVREDERKFQGGALQGIIPAARDHRFQADLKDLLQDKPLCMVELAGKTLLDRQIELLKSAGVGTIYVVGGHLHEKIRGEGAEVIYNPLYRECQCAQSILCAQDQVQEDVLIVYSDILFDRKLLERILESPHEVTLAIDRAYATLPARDKTPDLVRVEEETLEGRRLGLSAFKRIEAIGPGVEKQQASHEFTGVALVRRAGFQRLREAWKKIPNARQADFTDLLSHLMKEGDSIHGLEIEHGWSELHSLEDIRRVRAYYEKMCVHA